MIDYDGIERAVQLENGFIHNSATRVPICICVDGSLSMAFNQGINHVNTGIKDFINKTADNIYSCDAVELCVVVFGPKTVQTAIEFSNIAKIRDDGLFKPIEANGGSPLGYAVEVAVDKIKKQKETYNSYGIAYYTPWLIIMSDGEASDPIDRVAAKVIQMQKPHDGKKAELKVQCIGMGDGDEENDLKKFSLNGSVKKWNALQIENFFNYLSESATQLSCAYPGEEDTIGLL